MSITYKPVEPAEAGVGESMPESFVKEAERSRERFVSLIDETERLQAENDKLRKLARGMMRYYFMPSTIDRKQRETKLLERAHELGVEEDNGELGVEVDG